MNAVNEQLWTLIGVGTVALIAIGGLALLSQWYTLDNIKSRTVGDGQHGTARWATRKEIRDIYSFVPFQPELWRQGKNLPKQQGLVLGCVGGRRPNKKRKKKADNLKPLSKLLVKGKKERNPIRAIVDTDDIHALVTAASGAGKTAFFLYPNIEYALASGMSFLCTDTKGDLFRNYAGIAKEKYHFNTASCQDLSVNEPSLKQVGIHPAHILVSRRQDKFLFLRLRLFYVPLEDRPLLPIQ